MLKNVLKKMNLLDRFKYYEGSPRSEDDFKQAVEAFYAKLVAMPQCKFVVKEAK